METFDDENMRFVMIFIAIVADVSWLMTFSVYGQDGSDVILIVVVFFRCTLRYVYDYLFHYIKFC